MLQFLSLAILVACTAAYDKDGEVLVLHDSDLADAIAENEFLLVEFYAPWCGHCKNLEPHYKEAAEKLAGLDTPIRIAKVDATEEKAAGAKYEVKGYPTLKWFVNGEMMEYTGGRTADTIVSWIKKKTGPAVKALADGAAVDAFKSGADVVVVAFLDAASAEYATFESAARSLEDAEFGSADAAAAAAAGVEFPSIVLFKDFDEGKNVFEGAIEVDALKTFVQSNSVPLISTFSQESAGKIFGAGIDSHFLYFNDAKADTHEGILESLRSVATEYKGKTLFVFVPASEDRVMGYFDLKAEDLPASILVAMGNGDMKKFALDKEITSENVAAHVGAFHNGELKPTMKSEDAPADNSGPVTVIVGTNFEEIVMDDSKDVLLEFYAPWCGHCKSLAPTWEELGAKFADNANAVIAKIDATANDVDHPAVSVKGFPTILFFPAGSKASPVTYEGGRDLDSLVEFMNKNAKAAPAAAAAGGHAHDDL